MNGPTFNRRHPILANLAIYVPLIVFAAITLIPFAYLASSAFKPKSVFFTSPFLPEAGLFDIDEATGDLSVVDITLLPQGPGASEIYELTVAVQGPNGAAQARQLRISYDPSAPAAPPEVDGEPTDFDFVIPVDSEVNQSLGRVELPDGVTRTDENGDPVPLRFAITGGNPEGLFGRAWGLLTLDNFDRLFRGNPNPQDPDGPRQPTGIGRAILNSFFFASVSAVLATLGAAMGGYALAKFRFKGRDLLDNIVLGALVIPGALLIAPGFQLIYWLGLLDSYVGLILPGIAPAFGIYLFRQAMLQSMPDELMEAARIDGCGEIRIFFQMALPMVRPMAGAFMLITYLGAWNNFIGPQIILSTPEKMPLAVWISQLRGVYGIDYGLIMAGTLVAIAPVLGLFLLLQKEFIAGLTAGAVKG
ncbi:MAG: carbohydrate ABC transporter permease [Planctomycetota bacterium]